MLKKLKNWIAVFLAIAVVFLSLLAILSVWGIIDSEIAPKLLGTLAIILA